MTRPLRRYDRLVHTGNAVLDVVLRVPRLPDRGGDVLASTTERHTGGGFNVMAAAARLGLSTGYAGAHGSGPNGDRVRTELTAEGIALLTSVTGELDTGFVICLVDDGGERTFVTSPGAEAHLRVDQLSALAVTGRDVVYVSGYSLAHPDNRAALTALLARLPASVDVAFDPGPLAATLPADALRAVLARTTWLSCNAAEARALCGAADPADAAVALRHAAPLATVVVRADRRGAVLAEPGADAVEVPAVDVAALDSTGAGDAHTGALLAALAEGRTPVAAVELANVAAAIAVTRAGPATGPARAELPEWDGRNPGRGGPDG